jgi:hypothetical protein
LYYPSDVQVDAAGNLFIADTYSMTVREVPAASNVTMTAGYIYTIVGTGTPGYSGDGGPATSAMIGGPRGLAAGPGGNPGGRDNFGGADNHDYEHGNGPAECIGSEPQSCQCERLCTDESVHLGSPTQRELQCERDVQTERYGEPTRIDRDYQ